MQKYTAKPAGPSTRPKIHSDKCPRCAVAMVAGLATVYACLKCRAVYEAA